MQTNDSFKPLFKAIAIIFFIFLLALSLPFIILIFLAMLPYFIAGIIGAVVVMVFFYLFREIFN